MRHPGRWVRARLHRRLFFWFGAAIILTGIVTGIVGSIVTAGSVSDVERLRAFASDQFAEVWDDLPKREALVERVHHGFEVRVILESRAGEVLERRGESCHSKEYTVDIERDGVALGTLKICRERETGRRGGFLVVLFAAGGTLWFIAAVVAHRVVRPLRDLVRVTNEIGAGKLSSRVRLGRHHSGEVGELAESVNLMAERIERQIEDQRELLAGVSHEIRTPLTRLRVLVELARERGAEEKTLDGLEREVRELDDLVGQLLASSRLEFSAMNKRELRAKDVASRAIDRAGLDPSVFFDDAPDANIVGDATLLGRALANLLDNASRHGGRVVAMRLRREEGQVVFEVADDGDGFPPEFLPRAFEAFTRSPTRPDDPRGGSSLGLGLALVKRIVAAHGGVPHAANRTEKGARVGFRLPEKHA